MVILILIIRCISGVAFFFLTDLVCGRHFYSVNKFSVRINGQLDSKRIDYKK